MSSYGTRSQMSPTAGDRFVDPRHPFGRVEPPVAQFDEPSGFQGLPIEVSYKELQ